MTTPSGEVIEYRYQPLLGAEPVLRRLPQAGAQGVFDEATYVYDDKNARLLACEEQGLKLTRAYFSTGELKSEKREVGGNEFTMTYQYSRLGRLLGYTDVLGQKQDYEYDPQGRLKKTVLGTTASAFTYDSLNRTATIHTGDSASGQSVGITLQYDEFDRETLRRFDLNGLRQELSQVYNDVDGLKQRTLMEGATLLRDETYEYDLRGRLTNYGCTGTQPPVDPYGKPISQQIFSFDALDNITLLMTYFGSAFNRARYFYDNPDKTQLSKVTNNHADYPPQIDLKYNPGGHLILDEEQRTLDYDALGRLISVSGSSSGASRSYGYDPLDKAVAMNDGTGAEQRFYQGDLLANQIKGATSSTFMRGHEVVLAEHQAGANPKSLLLASDLKNSVMSEVSKSGRKDNAYSVYGYRGDDPVGSGALGYNGELREVVTGSYLLGDGHRSFNPTLMRFHSPDRESPFEEGGVNPYAYCGNDPANFEDPTGKFRFFAWVAKFFGSKASTGAKVASTGAKTTKAASAGKKVSKVVNSGTNNGQSTSVGGKTGRSAQPILTNPKRSGAINAIKGKGKSGFWNDLKDGKIQTDYTKPTQSQQSRAPVQGTKFGESLENPKSGAERLSSRLGKSLMNDNAPNMKNDWSQASEVRDGIRSHFKN